MKRILTLTFLLCLFSLVLTGQIRIYEIYGGGGNSGATIKNDYVILYNPTASSVSLVGWGLQYASATGNFGSGTGNNSINICNLGGTIPAGGYYLAKLAAGSGGTEIANFDVSGNFTGVSPVFTMSMSATAGKVVLINNQSYFQGATSTTSPTGSNVVDFVGFGTTANGYEGTGSTPAPTNTMAVRRKNSGQDTNDNSVDFEVVTPNPQTTLNQKLDPVVIPVELLDFKAQKENQAVKLLWSTATELNNAFYAVERSENGKSFEKIGEINGYGNSNVKRTYEFMDEKPLNAVNYYRLRQVDFDGKETVYKTVSVNFGKNTTTKVYPSIAKDNINVEINGGNGAADLVVVNLLGQVVKAQKLQNTEGVFPVNISELPNGSYIMRIISKNETISQRFEKQ